MILTILVLIASALLVAAIGFVATGIGRSDTSGSASGSTAVSANASGSADASGNTSGSEPDDGVDDETDDDPDDEMDYEMVDREDKVLNTEYNTTRDRIEALVKQVGDWEQTPVPDPTMVPGTNNRYGDCLVYNTITTDKYYVDAILPSATDSVPCVGAYSKVLSRVTRGCNAAEGSVCRGKDGKIYMPGERETFYVECQDFVSCREHSIVVAENLAVGSEGIMPSSRCIRGSDGFGVPCLGEQLHDLQIVFETKKATEEESLWYVDPDLRYVVSDDNQILAGTYNGPGKRIIETELCSLSNATQTMYITPNGMVPVMGATQKERYAWVRAAKPTDVGNGVILCKQLINREALEWNSITSIGGMALAMRAYADAEKATTAWRLVDRQTRKFRVGPLSGIGIGKGFTAYNITKMAQSARNRGEYSLHRWLLNRWGTEGYFGDGGDIYWQWEDFQGKIKMAPTFVRRSHNVNHRLPPTIGFSSSRGGDKVKLDRSSDGGCAYDPILISTYDWQF